MATRQLGDWLTGYLEYTKDTEPPKSFHTWIGLSMIAGALQRKVYTRYGHAIIYPNLYIILVGKSGGARKGTAMKIGKDVLKDVQGVELVAESITREKLIVKFEEVSRPRLCSDNIMRTQAAMTCFSEELSVFLGQKDIKFLSDLTDFYDSADDWKYETKNRGDQHIQGICFNLLGATAPDWMQSMFPQEAIGGGFTSRVIFVFEERKGKTIPEEVYTDYHVKLRGQLVNDLSIISNLSGEFRRTDSAREEYNKWYVSEEKKMQNGVFAVDDSRFAGYCERRANHIRKLSMVVSASRSNELVIDKIDFDRALDLMTSAEKKMHKVFGGLGRSQYSEAVEMVLDYLLVHKSAKRSEIMRMFYRDIDSNTLKIVEEVLTHMKVVRIHVDPINNEVRYELTI